jgi:hypothetical protein
VQAKEAQRAVAAAMAIASSLDLPVDDAIVLNDSTKLTLRLLPGDVLARVAPVALLHGEPHPGNVLNTKNGLLFIDLARFMRLIHLGIGLGGMALRLVQVNFKARDDSALGRFWADALGWGASSEEPGATSVRPAGSGWPAPAVVTADVIAVPDPETVKYRAHLHLATTSADHRAELVARLKELGATPADVGQGEVPSTVLADPEGNVFCVLEPREIYRDTGPIAAVVVDCSDPRAIARFWGEAMDWTLHEMTDDHAVLRSAEDVGPYLEFLRTPHLKDMWHRVHLDLLPDPVEDQAAEVARLEALGAKPADVGQGDVPWKVLADPEGNEFCVLGRG